MSDYLPFVVIGLSTGAIYALAATGLVLTYKTSGIFNFAHGAVGMIVTYIFYSLRIDVGMPTPLAFALSVVVIAPLLGYALNRTMLRWLPGATPTTFVVVSLGLLVFLQGVAIKIYGAAPRVLPSLFPRTTFQAPGVRIGWDQLIVVAVSVAAALALVLFFRLTHLGLQTRAVVEDATLAEYQAVDSRRVTSVSWMLGTAFAALSGILIAPFLGLDATLLTLLVVQAFGAAAVGRLTNLTTTFLAGLGIGVVISISSKFVATRPDLAGLPTAIPFLVLFVVLVASRKGSFVEVTKSRVGVRTGAVACGRSFPTARLASLLAIGLALPLFLRGTQLLTATSTLAFVLMFSSLSLLIGLSRQLSLCQATFVVFGATTLGHLMEAGVPHPVALVLAGLLVVPVGALVAIPAIRLSGLFLALATFGFGILAQNLLFPTSLAFGTKAVVVIHRPAALQSDIAIYWFALAVVTLGVVLVEILRVSRLGRILRALADSPTAVESIGIVPTVPRVLVFCTAGFLAAVSGGLLGTLTQSVNPYQFHFFNSLIWLTVLVGAGAATLGGSVLAAVLLVAVPAAFTSRLVVEYQPIFFGLAAMFLAQAPNGIMGLLRLPDMTRVAERSRWRIGTGPGARTAVDMADLEMARS
jgi:branched-subunit amino acid ABC-type transport system permease component